MMCGVLAIMSQHYKDAQTFLERATGIDPQSVEAWTLLGETCHLAANIGSVLFNYPRIHLLYYCRDLLSVLLVFKLVFCIKKIMEHKEPQKM